MFSLSTNIGFAPVYETALAVAINEKVGTITSSPNVISRDSKAIQDVGTKLGAKIIKRPAELATSEAILEDTFLNAYQFIKNQSKEEIELIVIL